MSNSSDNSQFDITAEAVTKSFGGFEALRGIDLNIKKGEFVTLFGPNGAGKTTLIKLLSTLAKPSSGKLTVSGYDTSRQAGKVRASVGVIAHDPFLYENLSAFENIKFFGDMYGLPDSGSRSEELIKLIGLGTRIHDLVRTFSRGMKQRLSVARAIVHDPSVLLLDEPYTGLDQKGAQMFGSTLEWLKSHQRTILMTTHNIEEGLQLSDRVGIITSGKIVYESSASKIDKNSFKEIYLSHVD
jgi:heme exporter protein A